MADGGTGASTFSAGVVKSSGGTSALTSSTIVDADVNASAAIAPTKLAFTQAGTGASTRTVDAKLKEVVSVLDFGAVGDGTTNDTTAFSNAVATGKPVFVPQASSFYSLTSLTAAQQKMLFGPGVVKVSGTQVQIPSEPFVDAATANIRVINQDLQPSQWQTSQGSLFNGAINIQAKRTGGFGSYGLSLTEYVVSDSLPSGEFDSATTTWLTGQNLTGGALFGAWCGANTPSASLSQTFSSGSAIGLEVNVGNRWSDFGLQDDVGGTRYTVGIQVVPDVLPAPDGATAAIYPGTFGVQIGKSINSHKWHTGLVVSENSIAPSGRVMNIIGGSSSGNAAAVLLRASGHINAGIDVSGTTMTGNAFVAGSCDNALYSAGTMSRGIDFGSATITNAAIRVGTASTALAGTGTFTHGVSFANATAMSGTAFLAGSCGSALLSAGTMTRGIDFSAATISQQAMLLNNSQVIQWNGGGGLNGGSDGGFGISVLNAGEVVFYANNYGVVTFRAGHSSNAATLGFFGATAIVRPASANQAALTNSTGGTRDGTLAAIGATNTADRSADINNNFTDLHVLVDEIRTALVNLGLMKGSA